MAKRRQVDKRWNEVRAVLATRGPAEVLGLVRDLYDLSQENRDVLNARYLAAASGLERYKNRIDDAMYPDVHRGEPVRISVAKSAISQYKKATGDQVGTLELMVYFVERGNQFTIDLGDIDEGFYSALASMFGRILATLKRSNHDVVDRILPRLVAIRDAAQGIGWGYYDSLCEALATEFPSAADDVDLNQGRTKTGRRSRGR